ncbi:unnamed protein product [Gordionus sp. m RMFG-2023]
MEAVVNTFGYKYPFSSTPNQSNLVTSSHNSISPYHFLVETIKTSDERFYECASIINCPRTVVARNESESSDIWKLRENIYPALCQYKNPDLFISYDVSLPLKSWPELVQRLYQVSQDTSVQDLETTISCCGHFGDENIHATCSSFSKNEFTMQTAASNNLLQLLSNVVYREFPAINKINYSISAEHGIGLLKASHFASQSNKNMALSSIKSLFDESGILNPYKIFL